MKTLITTLAVVGAGLGVAAAQDMGPVKIGVHVGGSFVVNDDVQSTGVFGDDEDPSTVARDFEFDGGFAAGLTAAVPVTDTFMVEAEYTFRNNEFAEGPVDDDFNTSAFMANALLPMAVDETTTGYLGVGAGYIMKHDSDRSVPVVDELDGAFAWQVKAGLDYDLGGRTVGFGLTYLSAEFEDDVDDVETEYDFGTLMATVSLKFGS